MATKVSATPVLEGEVAKRFYEELNRPSTPEEIEDFKKADEIFKKAKFIR